MTSATKGARLAFSGVSDDYSLLVSQFFTKRPIGSFDHVLPNGDPVTAEKEVMN